jgi:S-DNA-T family DNA segregation ATPase FtsK/SpoIIIE
VVFILFFSSLLILKSAGLVGSVFGAFSVYQSFPVNVVKSKLMSCFKMGQIYLVKKSNKKEVRTYPKIWSVKTGESTQVIFSLPLGLDPSIIHKHEWIFNQQFGNHLELTGSAKYFTLTIYEKPIEPFKYDYELMKLKQKLPIVAGMSRHGYEIYDMLNHPHLLITGETGAGKSTQLRSILCTLIKYLPPEKLHLYLADLKASEFFLFKDLPHVKGNVIKENDLKALLKKINNIMKERGLLLNQNEVAHIDDLKEKIPYIVLCVDEFALLKGNKDIMNDIETISSIGRALGVFLILSCLRPDAKIMDGKLKNNLTVRMAFRSSDDTNSRITLGEGGAEKIKKTENGLMLFKLDEIKRVQAPLLELEDAKEMLKEYKQKQVEEVEEEEDTLDVL